MHRPDAVRQNEGRRVIVDARLPWGSGIGRYVANTLPRVAELMPHLRFELIVAPPSVSVAQSAIAGNANVALTRSEIEPFSIAEQVRMPAKLAGADLVWFTNYWVPLGFRGAFIASVHDLLHQDRRLFPASVTKRTLSRWTFRHVARHAKGICCLSRFSEREFVERFGNGPDVSVCGCGIDHNGATSFDPEHPPLKTQQILMVAAPKFHKNLAMAVSAFRAAHLADKWRLVIVAPGDRLRSSIDLSVLIADDPRIGRAAAVSDAELQLLYAQSAIILMPSRYEGFGLPLAEGLQAGAQCISSTAEALVEVGQGAHVTFVNPTDLQGWISALEIECGRFDTGAVADSERRHNMRHAQRFRWDDVARRTAAVIERALNDSDTPRRVAKGTS